ncbi:putative high-affinity glucose transporter protein [Xylaria flabelliformis]|nr:putative high-affinity glucose transporter protein [Xylaria flabelliformis]
MESKLGRNCRIITATAVIGGMFIGFNIASMSAIIATAQYKCRYNSQGNDLVTGQCRGPDPWLQGVIMAAMPGGAWLSAILSAWLLDGYGPRQEIQYITGFWISGCMFVTFSVNVPMLIVGRFINGISVGMCSAQLPDYLSGISPPSVRGRLVSMYQWAVPCGMATMFFICLGCSFIEHQAAFRLPWGLQLIPAVLLLLGLYVLPENPRWLAQMDRWQEVREVLTLIHGKGDFCAPIVKRETDALIEAARLDEVNADVPWSELIVPNMINRTHVGLFTQIWSQLTGMNVMTYYATYVFAMAGQGDLTSSGAQFIIYAAMSVPALIWPDRMGRRPAMLIGASLMCFFMSLNAGLFAIYSRSTTSGDHFDTGAISMVVKGPPARGIIASTYLFVASYASTWGPASRTYPPGLYPLRVRSKAVALSTSASWFFDFALACFTPVAFATITWKTYVLFAVFCASMFIHCFFLFPETANKSSEEVAAIFEDNGPGSIKYIGTPAWKTRNDRHATLQREINVVDPEMNPSTTVRSNRPN